ncbi:hypothetical protein GCM10009850_118910 [Nonomuraea monospora]|uniref:NADH:flavin oxidoreductase/NADH oxidase N-terminal domain-containing protein n=1 Tax=Nonomuraea monospora TaxID=568818 RepID=A0ABP5PXF8_9ACTN
MKGAHVHVRRRLNANGAFAKTRQPRAIPVDEVTIELCAHYQFERASIAGDTGDADRRDPHGQRCGPASDRAAAAAWEGDGMNPGPAEEALDDGEEALQSDIDPRRRPAGRLQRRQRPGARVVAGPGYQVPFAQRVRDEVGMPVAAVGLITESAQAEEIVASGRADAVLLGREFLRDPYWARRAAKELGGEVAAPAQYHRA